MNVELTQRARIALTIVIMLVVTALFVTVIVIGSLSDPGPASDANHACATHGGVYSINSDRIVICRDGHAAEV